VGGALPSWSKAGLLPSALLFCSVGFFVVKKKKKKTCAQVYS